MFDSFYTKTPAGRSVLFAEKFRSEVPSPHCQHKTALDWSPRKFKNWKIYNSSEAKVTRDNRALSLPFREKRFRLTRKLSSDESLALSNTIHACITFFTLHNQFKLFKIIRQKPDLTQRQHRQFLIFSSFSPIQFFLLSYG
jgi:hypothetical protein